MISSHPLFGMGFRPFFLFGVLHVFLIMLFWLGGLGDLWAFPRRINIIQWHAHEMIFGFSIAIVAGFLSTASANWTKSRGIHGSVLLSVFALWVLGRLGFWWVAFGGNPAFVWLDLAFVPTFAIAIAPPLLKARKWQNIAFLFWLGVFAIANFLVLAEFSMAFVGWGRRGVFLGLDVIVFLLILIGGRVLPFFTGNVIRDKGIRKWPTLDLLAQIAAIVFILAELVFGELHPVVGGSALLVGLLLLLRMRWWGSLYTLNNPILWVLHLAALWLVLGFWLKAMSCAFWVSSSAATHALTAGAIGMFVLGMISRVSLGHTGRALQVSWIVTGSYVLLLLGALLRVGGTLLSPKLLHLSLYISGSLWSLAFFIFVFVYWKILMTPRPDGKHG